MPIAQWQQVEYDDQYESGLGFPSTASWNQLGDGGAMYITYAGAPSTLFNNAPKGSLLLDTDTPDLYQKTAAAGTAGWEKVGVQT